ncbi:MAG: hypothetical protein A2166_06495 [Omnitrophica WOR_2 bacterium RBG_13_41_10]|nr:MAG: hypothetical protein A2166_06495 [Omnitrophica WOR_2 bacterium RBG_13_41_10]
MENKKGIALILAMFILVFISILAVAFLWLITSDLMITSNHLGKLKALYIAEAGIEQAVYQLRLNKNWIANQWQSPFPVGSNSSYTLTYPESGETRVIVSSAQVENNKFQATVKAKVSIKGASSPYTIRIVKYQETG